MFIARLNSYLRRHHASARDLIVIAVIGVVLAFAAFEIDIFENERGISQRQETIELDEVLLLGGVLAFCLLGFLIRLNISQRREVSRRAMAERRARELAYKDALTGLANRRRFDEALVTVCAPEAAPAASATHALLLMDLNGFKLINDIHGHSTGDEVLVAVANRLRAAVRDGDLVARFGGDEFAVLATHLAGTEAVTSLALRIIKALEEPVVVARIRHQVGAGIGIALIPKEAATPSEAIRKADVALYKAKAERRSALRFFEADMDLQLLGRATLEGALREAVSNGRIEARFTPRVDLRTRQTVGFEVLPSWVDGGREVPPQRFLSIAEETGLIHELQEQLLRSACIAAQHWPPHATISVALYASQLKSAQLEESILGILLQNGIAPARLELEIAESLLVQDMHSVRRVLTPLRERGVKLVLDQFGTGYSSLFHLRNFKVDRLKIDRSFTADMNSNRESGAVVEALIGLGRGLGIEVSIEGLDSDAQLLSLTDNGCQTAQGQRYGEAVKASATAAFFEVTSEIGLNERDDALLTAATALRR